MFGQNCKFGQNSKLGHSCSKVTKSKRLTMFYDSQDRNHANKHLGLNVSNSIHNCGYMVDGGNATAAI